MTAADIDRSRLSEAKIIVVKVGSALVTDGAKPRQDWLNQLAADIAQMRAGGREIILVSSGAIALGRSFLGSEPLKKLEDKQAAAALGQPLLMAALSQAFSAHDLPVAQSLLTLEDTENRRRWLNARATLRTLLAAGALPVINENDTVATDEIRYGDNDRLAARVAQMIGADVLVLLSDIDGLYTADPRVDSSAEHLGAITELNAAHDQMAGVSNPASGIGSGGMVTKLAAARIAWRAGCATVITRGDRPRPLAELLEGARATWILPPLSPDKAREIWLRGHLKPEGALLVDAGAAKALEAGASLLPVGLVQVEGEFARGAAVAVKGPEGQVIAKGVTAYSSADATRMVGLKTDAVEAVLGYRGRPALIHRDDLVPESRA